ncbi:MAG: tetratricopeptide repeat protein [Crocinitomicaceae bacterium]|nr:tetratricopeptide repeat protein [Crocinitomicaceae bacterium]
MNSNRLLNIFGLKRKLGREDIDAYNRTNDPIAQNEIEQASMSSDFENDAMEGWDDLSYDTSVMKNMDKKFTSAPNTPWYWAAGIVGAGILGLIAYNGMNVNTEGPIITAEEIVQENVLEDQTLTIDETDIIMPEEIEEMNVVPTSEQVHPSQMQDEFAEMIIIKEESDNPEAQQPVDELPIIEPTVPESPTIISSRITGKEIYLSEMKLVDYREYRAKPTVATKQYILTGTPADQETKEGEEYDATAQVVDVPYIDYIQKTMRILNRENFKKALSRFNIILETYPDDVNANFYAGLCLYNFGEYDAAIEHFDKCLKTNYSNFDEESLWLIALSYEHIGSRSTAREIFKEIVEANGFYSAQAKSKL